MNRSRSFKVIMALILVLLLAFGLYGIFPKHTTLSEALLEDIEVQKITSVEITLPDLVNSVVIEDPAEIQIILNSFSGLELRADHIEHKTIRYIVKIRDKFAFKRYEISLYEDGFISISNPEAPQKERHLRGQLTSNYDYSILENLFKNELEH